MMVTSSQDETTGRTVDLGKSCSSNDVTSDKQVYSSMLVTIFDQSYNKINLDNANETTYVLKRLI